MMKNLVGLLVLVVMFSTVPAMAQTADPLGFFDFFGTQETTRVGATVTAAGDEIKSQDKEEPRDLSSLEILRVFVERGFVVTPEEDTAIFVAEVEIFSRERQSNYSGSYYRYYYHRDPESLVYITVRQRGNGGIVAVGRGKSSNIRRAAEKAANDAAKKIKRYYKTERTIFLP